MQKFLENMTEVLEDTEASLIKAESILRDFNDWDSLAALSLIAMADQEYEVQLTGADIDSATTLEDIFKIIKSK